MGGEWIMNTNMFPYILKEHDFTYENFIRALDRINQDLDKCLSGELVGGEEATLGVPNWQTTIKGYGLITQRDITKLRLENLRLKGLDDVEMQKQFERASKELECFLSNNYWVVA